MATTDSEYTTKLAVQVSRLFNIPNPSTIVANQVIGFARDANSVDAFLTGKSECNVSFSANS